MTLVLVNWAVAFVGLYLLAGFVFAIPFVLRGARRIDPAAEGGTWGFRLAVFPGVVALWPLLARRWLGGMQPPAECNAHRRAAQGSRR